MFNKHDFAIHNKKNSHDIKRIKKENDIIFQFECQWSFRQRVALSFFSKYKKKKISNRLLK